MQQNAAYLHAYVHMCLLMCLRHRRTSAGQCRLNSRHVAEHAQGQCRHNGMRIPCVAAEHCVSIVVVYVLIHACIEPSLASAWASVTQAHEQAHACWQVGRYAAICFIDTARRHQVAVTLTAHCGSLYFHVERLYNHVGTAVVLVWLYLQSRYP
jgi:hypothetical protein